MRSSIIFSVGVFLFGLSSVVFADDSCGNTKEALAFNTKTEQCSCATDKQLADPDVERCPEPQHSGRGENQCLGPLGGCFILCHGDLILNDKGDDCGCPPGYVEHANFKCKLVPSSVPRVRRSLAKRDIPKCPSSLETPCTLSHGGFECLDTSSSLNSCGGCPGAGGVDCSAIPGVKGATCQGGKCVVYSCHDGFVLESLDFASLSPSQEIVFNSGAMGSGVGRCVPSA